jgi:hypothetical protein
VQQLRGAAAHVTGLAAATTDPQPTGHDPEGGSAAAQGMGGTSGSGLLNLK